MRNVRILTVLILTLMGAGSCADEAPAPNGNANSLTSGANKNSGRTSESPLAESVRLKPPAPCSWFEESLKLPAKKYEQSPTMPDMYYCIQVKPLVNQSNLEYHVVGDAENVKYLYVSVHSGVRNSLKQDAELSNMLDMAAQDILDRVSGQKLSQEILDALLMSETKDYTLEPGADKTKPQIKTISIKKQYRDGKPWKFVEGIELHF